MWVKIKNKEPLIRMKNLIKEKRIIDDVMMLFRQSFIQVRQDSKNIESVDYLYDLWERSQDYFQAKEYPIFLASSYKADKTIPFEVFYSHYLMLNLFNKQTKFTHQKRNASYLRLVVNNDLV